MESYPVPHSRFPRQFVSFDTQNVLEFYSSCRLMYECNDVIDKANQSQQGFIQKICLDFEAPIPIQTK